MPDSLNNVHIIVPKELREQLKSRKKSHQALAGVIEELLNGVPLTKETVDRLDTLKHTGQTYDGVINEMIDEIQILLAQHKNHKEK